MTKEEAIEWIHSRVKFGSKPGLKRIKALLKQLNNPEEKVEMIHIAGTNGKGSTTTYLRNLLEESGLTVGAFTSPYIEDFNERIAINGRFIPDDELIRLVKKVQPIVADLDKDPILGSITEFELLTAMAFLYFYEEKVDIAIIEVGLGGLLDSTNVITPVLTGITTIGLDHTDILGETLPEIAAQKAGIIKKNIPVITGNIEASALAVILDIAQKKQAPAARYGQEYVVSYRHPDENWGEVFDFENERGKIKGLHTGMIGRYQTENAGLAIELYSQFCQMKNLPFSEKDVKKAVKQAQWPARMEKLNSEPLVVLDGAHNPHAVARLVETVKKEFADYEIKILFSAINTKDIETMIQQLLEIPNAQIFLTTFEFFKAMRLEEKYREIDKKRITMASLWQFGLADLLEKSTNEELILVTGSLYFVSEVRKLLLEMGEDDD